MHLLSSTNLSRQALSEIFTCADHLASQLQRGKSLPLLQGKILASLFFEPSTRTRFSFEAAMLRLGGQVIGLESGLSSSVQKGESLEDTGRMVSCYADIMVVRHPEIGAADRIARFASIPVINAGDGSNQHPTQALLDVYTILRSKGSLDGLTIGIFGDLRYGRAVRSLLDLLALFPVRVVLIAPDALMPQAHEVDYYCRGQIRELKQETALHRIIGELDVLYCTRIQRERFPNPEAFREVQSSYRLTAELLPTAKPSCMILHPLPRFDELSVEIDNAPQAHYFAQAQNGLYIRMALLSLLCSK